jgi:thrombospondin type 3 repeat protein
MNALQRLFPILVFVTVFASPQLIAQQDTAPRDWILTLQGAVTKYYGDFTDNRFASGGAITLKKFYHELSSEEAIYLQAGIGGYDLHWRINTGERQYFDTTLVKSGDILRTFVLPLSVRALWRRKVGPEAELFLGTGLEFTYYSPQDVNGSNLTKLQDDYGHWTLAIPINAEFEFMLDDMLALNIHATYHLTFSDYLDGYSAGSSNDDYLTAGIGISYSFPAPDKDSDYDGLTNREEREIHSTNPYDMDTDRDGLSDLEEILQKTDPLNPDTDFDGMYDGTEVHHWATDPLNSDTDSDGLKDLEETIAKTNPLMNDSDGDGLNDKVEINRGTNPLALDTDGDNLPDGLESTTSPLLKDSDGDGLNDREETAYQLRNHDEDFDNDGLYDGQEIEIGTDPKKADTDNDEAGDYVEYYCLMSDPRNPDTDGDGILDGYDPSPLENTPLNPAKNVRWSFSSLFHQQEPNVDESSRSFMTLLHLIRSAPKGLLFSISIVVYGRTVAEMQERKTNLDGLLRKMTNYWAIPPLAITSEITSDVGLHTQLNYVWKVFPSKK